MTHVQFRVESKVVRWISDLTEIHKLFYHIHLLPFCIKHSSAILQAPPNAVDFLDIVIKLSQTGSMLFWYYLCHIVT